LDIAVTFKVKQNILSSSPSHESPIYGILSQRKNERNLDEKFSKNDAEFVACTGRT
jgi:hypothetical protein